MAHWLWLEWFHDGRCSMSKQLDNMTFKVESLGVVKEGKFTQKPLTIFCGPNNSGKTWVMYSLYYTYRLLARPKKDPGNLDETKHQRSLESLKSHINENLASIFNTSKELLGSARFIPSFGEEELQERMDNLSNPFLIPAERSGLHLFYRELSTRRTALLHHASKESIDLHELLQDVISSPYAIPISDYITWLNQLAENQRGGCSCFHKHGEYLKRNLVRGNYKVDRSTRAITFKPYQLKRDGNSTKSLGLHMTSSTVKSLFGLWFYLEYQAQTGDLLMIDEPELNLHPENQRRIARFLAKLVNAGLNIVISTHSDYIIRELNSLIMLSNKGAGDLRKKYKYEDDEVLDSNKVGAYLFDDRTITPFKILPSDGIVASTFDEVIRGLNEVNDDIYYGLQEMENEQ